ncbi:gamma carbonic anhydrase family protein [Deinococcus apachensis]|uniref:gamma carbonic anhydrase family protein n=1 Tax=Deinococcus apachensis TaxID=309886 RepID=UPI0003676C2D|nr:gamma carbonic anhydrase family protein [Deinococcus apachensis]
MPVYALDGIRPEIHPTAFIAPSADLTGRVSVAEEASVWFGAAARGDIEPITIGPRCNVQDGAVLHTDAGYPCTLEADVTVGHRAVVHGAHCAAGSLVGMGAVMLNGSRLGAGAVLAAGALLREGQHVPDGMLAVGVPARVVREVEAPGNAPRYVEQAIRYRRGLTLLEPVTATGRDG